MSEQRTQLEKAKFLNPYLDLIQLYGINDLETLLHSYYHREHYLYKMYDLKSLFEKIVFYPGLAVVATNPIIPVEYALLYADAYISKCSTVDEVSYVLHDRLAIYRWMSDFKDVFLSLIDTLQPVEKRIINHVYYNRLKKADNIFKNAYLEMHLGKDEFHMLYEFVIFKLQSTHATTLIENGYCREFSRITMYVPYNIMPLSRKTYMTLNMKNDITTLSDVVKLFDIRYTNWEYNYIDDNMLNELFESIKPDLKEINKLFGTKISFSGWKDVIAAKKKCENVHQKRTPLNTVKFSSDQLEIMSTLGIKDLETILYRYYNIYQDTTAKEQKLYKQLYCDLELSTMIKIITKINPVIHKQYAMLYADLYVQPCGNINEMMDVLISDLQFYKSASSMAEMMRSLVNKLPYQLTTIVKLTYDLSSSRKHMDKERICAFMSINHRQFNRLFEYAFLRLRSVYARSYIKNMVIVKHLREFNPLRLSTRTYNMLDRNGIYTIDKVAKLFTHNKWKHIHGLGIISANEIYRKFVDTNKPNITGIPNPNDSWRKGKYKSE